MGATKLNLNQLELNVTEEIYLKLTDPARPLKDLGEIKIIATLMPRTQEDKEQVKVLDRLCVMKHGNIFFFFFEHPTKHFDKELFLRLDLHLSFWPQNFILSACLV